MRAFLSAVSFSRIFVTAGIASLPRRYPHLEGLRPIVAE
jgi:hypothetical protein